MGMNYPAGTRTELESRAKHLDNTVADDTADREKSL